MFLVVVTATPDSLNREPADAALGGSDSWQEAKDYLIKIIHKTDNIDKVAIKTDSWN